MHTSDPLALLEQRSADYARMADALTWLAERWRERPSLEQTAAAVGLSALTGVMADASGRAATLVTTAVFLEESGEALAGVTFVLAVLVGVAPALVLPGTWALRRRADADGLTLPERRPGNAATGGSAPR